MAHMHDTPRRIIAAAVTLLLLCVVHYTQEAHAVTASDFTAGQKTHTARFLKGFLSGATELQSRWTGTDFCGWSHVSCPDATTVNVVLSRKSMRSNVTLAELSDDVDGSQVMVRELRVVDQDSLLAGTLPGSWWRLTQLRELDLQYNGLHGTLPASWGGMTALNKLYLHVNELTGTLPTEWASMRSLEKLWLTENLLSGSLPAPWGNMNRLQLLDLGSNSLTGTLPPEWGGMTALNKLHLYVNELTGTLPTEWASMKAVWGISLMNNSLSGPLPAVWGSLPRETYVYVTDNTFCGCVPATWSSLKYFVDAPLSSTTCASANACPAPAKSSVRNLTALWVVLGLLGCCLSIAAVVIGVCCYCRSATAAAATTEERGDINVVSDTNGS